MTINHPPVDHDVLSKPCEFVLISDLDWTMVKYKFISSEDDF